MCLRNHPRGIFIYFGATKFLWKEIDHFAHGDAVQLSNLDADFKAADIPTFSRAYFKFKGEKSGVMQRCLGE